MSGTALLSALTCRQNIPPGGGTPLYTAAQHGQEAAAQFLLDKGARIDAKTHHGWMPLTIAAMAGHLGTANLLLNRRLTSRRAVVNARTRTGKTALHAAAMRGHLSVVQAFMAAGADAGAKTNDGRIARDYAVENKLNKEGRWEGTRGRAAAGGGGGDRGGGGAAGLLPPLLPELISALAAVVKIQSTYRMHRTRADHTAFRSAVAVALIFDEIAWKKAEAERLRREAAARAEAERLRLLAEAAAEAEGRGKKALEDAARRAREEAEAAERRLLRDEAMAASEADRKKAAAEAYEAAMRMAAEEAAERRWLAALSCALISVGDVVEVLVAGEDGLGPRWVEGTVLAVDAALELVQCRLEYGQLELQLVCDEVKLEFGGRAAVEWVELRSSRIRLAKVRMDLCP